LELNVCGLNLNVIQIQTKLQTIFKTKFKTLTSNSGLFSLKPTRRPSPVATAAQQPSSPALLPFSFSR
jgi:hypothetical protein